MNTTIDTFELARGGKSLSGELTVDRMQRLGSLLASSEGRIAWRLQGRRLARVDGSDDFMDLEFEARLQPACVRCLQPVPVLLSVTRSYRLVPTEELAQRLDPEDEEYDVLAGASRFDLAALVEDEAILELPPAPRHDRCPEPLTGPSDSPMPAEEPENPFAALGRLRRNGLPDGGEPGP